MALESVEHGSEGTVVEILTTCEESKVGLNLRIPTVMWNVLVPQRSWRIALDIGHNAIDDGSDPGQTQRGIDEPLPPAAFLRRGLWPYDTKYQSCHGGLGWRVGEGRDELDDVVDVRYLFNIGSCRGKVVQVPKSSE